MKTITMQQIAEKLGISKSLVSLALNDKYGVSSEMRFLILKTAIELGYNFNYNYKNKNSRERKKILLFVRNRDFVRNDYWNDLLKGSEKLLSEHNYKFEIVVWDDNSLYNPVSKIIDGSVAAALVIDDLNKSLLDLIVSSKIPIVFVDGKDYLDKDFDNIRTNNYLGGFLAAEYLVSHGHKRIAFVGDKEHSISFRERFYGFSNYINEHKDAKLVSTIIQSTFEKSEEVVGESNIVKAFKKENRPSALFCANDVIAKFVYNELRKIGLEPYKDYSIIGFDDINEAKILSPALTSVKVPIQELGETAVSLIFDRLKDKNSSKKAIQLSVSIVERESVRSI